MTFSLPSITFQRPRRASMVAAANEHGRLVRFASCGWQFYWRAGSVLLPPVIFVAIYSVDTLNQPLINPDFGGIPDVRRRSSGGTHSSSRC